MKGKERKFGMSTLSMREESIFYKQLYREKVSEKCLSVVTHNDVDILFYVVLTK